MNAENCLNKEKFNTTVDVWTPDAVFHFAAALALFILCFNPHFFFLKHFIKGYRNLKTTHFFSLVSWLLHKQSNKYLIFYLDNVVGYLLMFDCSLLIDTWVYHWVYLYRDVRGVTALPLERKYVSSSELVMGNHLMSPDFLLSVLSHMFQDI